MRGREEWAEFAAANGLSWEEGPCSNRDPHGAFYCTFVAGDFEFEWALKTLLGADRYVIVRMFPHSADHAGKLGATRIRFTHYPEKPHVLPTV